MSKAMDIADLIVARLKAAPAPGELATATDITGLDAIVYSQQNISTKITAAVGKASGTAITIVWDGHTTTEENAKKPRMAYSYTIEVISKPIIAGDELKADEVMESIIQRLWQWNPGGATGPSYNEAQVRGGGLVPDTKYLKYDLEVVIPATL